MFYYDPDNFSMKAYVLNVNILGEVSIMLCNILTTFTEYTLIT